MSKEQSDTSRSVEPPEINDLKLINGIGPAVERRLHGVGIYTYAQLAALSPADIAAAVADLAGLSAERIIKQDWIGQARRLASESISREAQAEIETPAELQASIEDAHDATPSFISQVEPAALVAENAESVPPFVIEVTEPVPPVVTSPGDNETGITPPIVAMTGMPRLRQIEMVPAGTHTPQDCLPYSQPFDVHLTLDLSDVKVSGDTQLYYSASIYGKSLEGHSRQAVGETSGIITPTPKVTVSVEGIVLSKGTYRLKAVVLLNPITTEPTQQTSLAALKDSDLLLIF